MNRVRTHNLDGEEQSLWGRMNSVGRKKKGEDKQGAEESTRGETNKLLTFKQGGVQ